MAAAAGTYGLDLIAWVIQLNQVDAFLIGQAYPRSLAVHIHWSGLKLQVSPVRYPGGSLGPVKPIARQKDGSSANDAECSGPDGSVVRQGVQFTVGPGVRSVDP